MAPLLKRRDFLVLRQFNDGIRPVLPESIHPWYGAFRILRCTRNSFRVWYSLGFITLIHRLHPHRTASHVSFDDQYIFRATIASQDTLSADSGANFHASQPFSASKACL